jgi:hypothetical protein
MHALIKFLLHFFITKKQVWIFNYFLKQYVGKQHSSDTLKSRNFSLENLSVL